MAPAVVPGLCALLERPALLRGRRWAAVVNQASVTPELAPAWRELAAAGAGPPVRLFAPEHGLWGVAQDMEAVGEEVEPVLGVPVHSLYGTDASTLAPPAALLEDLDAVVFDLPDIGCRYYTFAATLAHLAAACTGVGVEVIVCDRPNPLGGAVLEGGPVAAGFASFVSELPTPVRHGLTVGEIALLLREERHPGLVLTVVPCQGWERWMEWEDTGLPWVAPSPNMPWPATAAIYPGACLVEGTALSEGRGTTRPFHVVGAPGVDGEALAARLNALAPAGVRFRATVFRPEFGKHAGRRCPGVEWHVTDRRALRSLSAGVLLLREIRALAGEAFRWRREAYEFVADVPAIDLLTGDGGVRGVVEGRQEMGALEVRWERHCEAFRERRRSVLLYPEEP